VNNVAGMASQGSIFDSLGGGNFDVTITIPNLDPRLRPGLTAELRFVGETQKDMLFVPRIAVFVKDGRHIVYVRSENGYEQREVKLVSANESRSAITGVAQGTLVALRDPTAPVKTPTPGAGAGGIL
jgi:HlyD family secretion protein